jgi:hypothetical protein
VSALVLLSATAACRSREGAPAPAGPPADDRPHPWFREITAEAGLDFQHRSDLDGSFFMPQNIGSGGALFDYDRDGDLDVYLVDSGSHRPGPAVRNRLFRQETSGRFVDRTGEAGLGDAGYGMGCAVGDVDGDGDLDVYVTNYGRDALYANDGRGRFTEVTTASGLGGGESWSTSACFFDYDGDGALDLFVATYVHYPEPRACTDSAGRPEYCGPGAFRGTADLLYRNRGDGTFAEAPFGGSGGRTAVSPTGAGGHLGKGLGVVCVDLDGDGLDDVYVANDAEPNTLWINLGDGRFEERSVPMGAATNALGQPEASMGVALGDVDGDLDPDLFLTHLDRETNTLYLNLGQGFQDATALWDVGRDSLPYTGFGAAFFDAENDGDLDLLVANGRVRRGPRREVADVSSDLPDFWRDYAEPNLFYLNDGGKRFENRSELAGLLASRIEVSRSLMTADVDRDGSVDVLVTQSNGPARLFRNEAPAAGRWLEVRAFDADLDRDALGARVRVDAGGRERLGIVTSTYSYLASVEPVVHFGLGDAERVDRLTVEWPGGGRQSFAGLPVDRRIYVVRRGRGAR